MSGDKTINDSRLISLLYTFTKKERDSFKTYLQSSYLNNREDVLDLFLLINPKKKMEKPLFKTNLVLKLFPDNHKSTAKILHPADNSRLRNTMSKLLGLAEDFLVLRRQVKNEVQYTRLLTDILSERGLFNHARAKLNSAMTKMKKTSFRNQQYFYDEFLLEEAKFFLDIIEKNRSKTTRADSVATAFRNYSLYTMLIYNCATVNQSQILNISYDLSFFEHATEFMISRSNEFPLIIKLYFHILNILKIKDADEDFYAAKLILEEHSASFSKKDLGQAYNFLLNYCSRRIRHGQLDFSRQKFLIYQHTLSSDIWSDKLYLSAHHFLANTANALEIGEIEATVNFMENYRNKLNPAYLPEIPNLCCAALYFHKKEYDKSFEYLRQFSDPEDFFYSLYYRALLIKLHYENNSYEAMASALEALRIYLLKKRSPNLSSSVRDAYSEFRRFAQLVLKAKESISPANTGELHLKIEKSPNLYERAWLMEKVK